MIKRELGKEKAKEMLVEYDIFGANILHNTLLEAHNFSELKSILKSLKDEIGEESAKKMLKQKNKYGENILYMAARNSRSLSAGEEDFFSIAFNFLEQELSLEELKEMILELNNEGFSILDRATFNSKRFLDVIDVIKTQCGKEIAEKLLIENGLSIAKHVLFTGGIHIFYMILKNIKNTLLKSYNITNQQIIELCDEWKIKDKFALDESKPIELQNYRIKESLDSICDILSGDYSVVYDLMHGLLSGSQYLIEMVQEKINLELEHKNNLDILLPILFIEQNQEQDGMSRKVIEIFKKGAPLVTLNGNILSENQSIIDEIGITPQSFHNFCFKSLEFLDHKKSAENILLHYYAMNSSKDFSLDESSILEKAKFESVAFLNLLTREIQTSKIEGLENATHACECIAQEIGNTVTASLFEY